VGHLSIQPGGRSQAYHTRPAIRPAWAPLLNASFDLDLRVVPHDYNINRLQALFEKYGPTAATTEHIGDECLLILCSQLPDKSTDELIAEFAIEPMRDYLTRARRDRQRALHGTYPTTR
jgi:hypothetical protein